MTDIETILQQLTLKEKAALCTGATPWKTTPIERLGVPEMFVSDGPHGVRKLVDGDSMGGESEPATCFPTASCQSASWNLDLVEKMGAAIAAECRALGVHVVLGPSNNMKRTPLCGRNFEYYAEDPYLSGRFVTRYIQAVQNQGVGTSLKHYAANNQEYQRFRIDTLVDERTLRELYLPAFEMAVKEAQPWTVMCAYNKVNGVYCSEHHELLIDILKHEWGFEGLVVSDWGAVHNRPAALTGGLDLEMPGPKPRRVQAVIDAVEAGELDEAALDEAVRRLLKIILRANTTKQGGEFDVDAHHALARQIAAEGIVLLKNEGLLPLEAPARIAVIGRSAKEPQFQGGGSSHINPTRVDIPFDELQKLAPQSELRYAAGYAAGVDEDKVLIDEAVVAAQEADVALIFVALPAAIESEGYDRENLNLTPQQVALIQAVSAVQPKTVVILNSGSAVAMEEWIDGPAALLEAWFMGQAGGGAIADVLFGKVNPSGKLAETFPRALTDTPAYINYPGGNGEVRYGEGLFIGYRYYDARQIPVRFPFGYGLSYTTFAYSNPTVSATTFDDVDGVTVSVDVTNTGSVAGKEIVQLYVHDHASELVRPHKELKGFAKVALAPGQTKTVQIELDLRAFAYYHPGHAQWITEDGDFDILFGASATDIREKVTVTLRSTLALPSILNRESTISEWLTDARGRVVLEPLMQQMMSQFGPAMASSEEEDRLDQESSGMDLMRFMLDLPLLSSLHFQAEFLPASPEEIVDDLLGQVHASTMSVTR
jgi:beta-glucosidase